MFYPSLYHLDSQSIISKHNNSTGRNSLSKILKEKKNIQQENICKQMLSIQDDNYIRLFL